MSRLVVDEAESGGRLDRVVAKLLDVPRSQVQRWTEDGFVTLNGKAVRSSAKVKSGDVILAEEPEPLESSLQPEAIPVVVLYEDESLIVVDKPAGLVVHPAPGHPRGTLVNALLHHCQDLAGIGGVLRPGIVHRLDRGTSGAIVVAKSNEAHVALSEQFKAHSVARLYRAWVRGVPQEGGLIDRPIGRHPHDRKRMSVATRNAREARTNWSVEARYPASGVARVAVRPETGRTHQIRVHLSSQGLPLLGDDVYGTGKKAKMPVKLTRPGLHAAELGFVHPNSGEKLHFESPLPEDLVELEKVLVSREGKK